MGKVLDGEFECGFWLFVSCDFICRRGLEIFKVWDFVNGVELYWSFVRIVW